MPPSQPQHGPGFGAPRRRSRGFAPTAETMGASARNRGLRRARVGAMATTCALGVAALALTAVRDLSRPNPDVEGRP